ncbi:MAG: peptidase S41 [Spirochaetales bacterium]|nr:peptidase S41 [Spirochaetales bacterium]
MQKNERYIWIGAGALAISFFALVAFSPVAVAQSGVTDSEEYLKTFREVFRFIEENFVEEVDPKTLYEGALKGMFDTLDDPYSYFLDIDGMESLTDITTGNFGGVGLVISKQTKSSVPDYDDDTLLYIEVVSPIEGTPAYRAGINAGDLIIKIGAESTEDLTIDEVVGRLRGVPGTEVQVTVLRGKKTEMAVSIVRDIIEVPTVKAAMIDSDIAYLKISQFTPFTDDRVRDAIADFERTGYNALVIDVRNNPGGRLSSVIDTADMFLESGTIVSTRSRVPRENDIFTATKRVLVPKNVPIAVLINKGSASASEILAGALRDNARAMIIGQTSYGKGSVQQVREIGDGGFKLTTSRYYTPSGLNIDKIGIEPDTVVEDDPLTDDEQAVIDSITEDNLVSEFLRLNPDPSDNQIDEFIDSLQNDGLILEDRIIKRLINTEVNRTNNNPPVFDLEFDIILKEAVDVLQRMTSGIIRTGIGM